MGKFFAGPRGRRERKKARKNLRLADLGVSPKTQVRYYDAVRKLWPIVANSETFEHMDDLVSEWVEERFSAGEPLNTIADGLSGLHYFIPSSKKKLPQSWKLFSVWRKYEIPSRAPPITADVVMAFAGKCLATLDFGMATLLLLGFHCCLRTGELLGLAADDLLVNEKAGIVHLRASKGGLRHNVKESVSIECPIVREVALHLIEIQSEAGLSAVPIWGRSGQAFRDSFQKLCKEFDVLHLNFRGYSLRRGGATAFFQATGSMERTLVRGRWASSSVARIYICDALSQIPKLKGTQKTKLMLAKYLPMLQPGSCKR